MMTAISISLDYKANPQAQLPYNLVCAFLFHSFTIRDIILKIFYLIGIKLFDCFDISSESSNNFLLKY